MTRHDNGHQSNSTDTNVTDPTHPTHPTLTLTLTLTLTGAAVAEKWPRTRLCLVRGVVMTVS